MINKPVQLYYDCKTCGAELECIDGEFYHARVEDFSHQAEPAATYHGIVKALCLNCGKVTTNVTSLEIMNDLDPTCQCGVHDTLWTLKDGTRSITQDLDDEGTVWFKIEKER
jgi:DNA-directed RNA polymerase subunit RPC12/RpoP